AVIERLFKGVTGLEAYKNKLSAITNTANAMLFKLVEEMSYAYETEKTTVHQSETIELECRELTDKLIALRDAFVLKNQTRMLKVLGVPAEGRTSAPLRPRKGRQR